MSVAGARADSEGMAQRAAGPTAPPELDEVTLRRAQRGDAAACRALVERYQRPVFALLHRMLGPARSGAIEDLAQETFLHVFRALTRFAPLGPARLSTWILTIASRRAVDELRRASSAPPESDGTEAVALSPSREAHRVIRHDLVSRSGGDRSGRADDGAPRSELAARVTAAIGAMAPEYRAAFLLREYHGFDYAAIARALDIDLGTVKSRLARARGALRHALKEEGERHGFTGG